MKNTVVLTCSAAMLFLGGFALTGAENLIRNGNFSEAQNYWNYEAHKGRTVPGRFEEDETAPGKKYFVFTVPGDTTPRFFRTQEFPVEPGKNYVLEFSLAGENVAANVIKVQLLEFKKDAEGKHQVLGWTVLEKSDDVLKKTPVSGTFDWKTFRIEIPAGTMRADATLLAVFFQNANPSEGELSIADVKFSEKGE